MKTKEKPYAGREGYPDLAGKYAGLQPGKLSKNLTNQDKNFNTTENKSDILDCDCGNSGCWPFLIKVSEKNEMIIWSDFE